MKKIILLLLGFSFLNGYIHDLLIGDRTYQSYMILFIGLGFILIYTLNKFISKKTLTWIQSILIWLNILMITVIYIYGYNNVNDSFGLGIMVWILLTILLSQLVILALHFIIFKLQKREEWYRYENLMIVVYTLVFFLFHQTQIPNNYKIPITTFILSYGVTFIFFGVLTFIFIKILHKDLEIPLLITLIILNIFQFGNLDISIFFLLPVQIIVILLLSIDLKIFKFSSMNQQISVIEESENN